MRGKTESDGLASARRLSFEGKEAIRRGDELEAKQCFESAIQHCPSDERAHCGYAEALWQQGQHLQAIAQMKTAVQLSGGDPHLYVKLARMELDHGDFSAASTNVQQAIRTNRHLASAWALNGAVMRAQGQYEAALTSYQRALSEQAEYPEVEMSVAEIYRDQGRNHLALATLDRLATRSAPSQQTPELLLMRGMVLKSLQRYEDAIASLTAAREKRPDHAETLFQLGDAFQLAGQTANSRLALEAAVQLNPRDRRSAELLAQVSDGRLR